MTDEKRSKLALKATWVGFFSNMILTLFKLAAGILGNSSAMIADAVHSFSDIASDIAVLFGLKAADRPRDQGHDYGHGKFETLVTAFIGIFLIGVAIGLVFTSARSLYEAYSGEVLPRPGWIAVAAAFVSIILKEGLFHYTMSVSRRTGSRALVANAWHHRTDSLSSIAVLIGVGGSLLLGGRWTVLDPIAAILVSLLIFRISYSLLKGSVLELTEASLDDGTEKRIIKSISSIEGAEDPHNLRTRRIGPYIAVDVHVKAPGEISLNEAHSIADRVERKLKEEFGEETYVHVHMDPDDV